MVVWMGRFGDFKVQAAEWTLGLGPLGIARRDTHTHTLAVPAPVVLCLMMETRRVPDTFCRRCNSLVRRGVHPWRPSRSIRGTTMPRD